MPTAHSLPAAALSKTVSTQIQTPKRQSISAASFASWTFTRGETASGRRSRHQPLRSGKRSRFCGPYPGNSGRAGGTTPLARNVDLANEITKPFDQQFVARRAVSVFPAAHSSRKISGVDVTKSGLATDFASANQLFGGRVGVVHHSVILMECGDVPGNVRRN